MPNVRACIASTRWLCVAVVLAVPLGCPDGPPGGDGDAGTTATGTDATTETTTAATTTTTATDSGGDTATTGGEGGTIDCPNVKDPLPLGTYPHVSTPEEIPVEVDGLCEDVIEMNPGEVVEIELRHPAVAQDGTWPDERLPLLIFTHGAQQSFDAYEHLLPPLAAEGFVVANIIGDPNSGAARRAAEIICVNRFFATTWPERNDHLNCDVAFMGHSNGGRGAIRAAWLIASAPEAPENQMTRVALVGIAPAPVDEEVLVGPAGVMALSVQGSRDEQVPGGALKNYDRASPEQDFTVSDPGKAVVWAYHVEHDAFGGGGVLEANNFPPLDNATMRAKGEAIAVGYVVPFLRYAVLGEDGGLRDYFTGSAFPPEVQVASWWNYLPGNPAGERGGSDPELSEVIEIMEEVRPSCGFPGSGSRWSTWQPASERSPPVGPRFRRARSHRWRAAPEQRSGLRGSWLRCSTERSSDALARTRRSSSGTTWRRRSCARACITERDRICDA